MTLPKAFIEDIKPYLSESELEDFVHSLTETEQTTCVRYNLKKGARMNGSPIGWNPADGRYLEQRPNFTLDPLMHAGCYYVQEASSQFVTHIVRTLVHEPVTALDLCAAPGGKSTALISNLPTGSQLVSNEIDRRRARILAENITKWGAPNVCVTCNAPKDFARLTNTFDLILTDVPCSGEGMFRKDEGAVADWSPQKVSTCVETQRDILETIWPTLKPGGLLIYSTCTFNVHEDEEILQYICEELGAEAISIPIEPEWNIHAPLKGELPCYRFMPHYTRGEGLFMCVVRKQSEGDNLSMHHRNEKTKRDNKGKSQSSKLKDSFDIKKATPLLLSKINCEATIEVSAEGTISAIPGVLKPLHDQLKSADLFLLQSGIEMGMVKGKDIIPSHALALSTARSAEAYPTAEVELETALDYLRHEAIVLPEDAPKGYVIITYQGHALGFVKNLGNRSNNLYPQEWRIRFL